jgi:2-polyprenyl-3-methyl-5-hydroxy-6-metoxy-1,4-benzoquinol methylase/uncharacterized protein YbaR (Trm112 family)
MFARTPFLALLACPRCRASVAAPATANGEGESLHCVACSAAFAVVDGIADLRRESDVRTDAVRAFYSKAPFPNYPPGDTFSAFRARGARSEFARLLDAAIATDARVLEIGCGTGQMSLYLATADRTVVAADLTRASLELGANAARRYGVDQVRFVETDLQSPGLATGVFDVVYTSGVLHHTPDPRASFAAIVPLVRPGGLIVVGLYNAYARVPHRLRRALARLTGMRFVPLDAVLRERHAEPARKQAWLRDQYLHPEEHRHTIAEVQRWFAECGVDYVRSYPNTLFGAEELRGDQLFTLAEDNWSLENVTAQVLWAFALGHEGGLWVTVGRRRESPSCEPVRLATARNDESPHVRAAAEIAAALAGIALIAWAWRADRSWWEEHVPVLHCATRPWQLDAARMVRAAALALGVGLVVVGRPRLADWVATDVRRAFGAIARLAVAALLALLVSELALRLRSGPAGGQPDVPATRADAHLGRVLVPSRTTEVSRGGRTISFAVNGLGLRARTEDDLPDVTRPAILVMGESIAQGYAVPYEESPPYLVERATGVPTLNAAVSAYANDQVYRHMGEILDRLERPLAVVTFVVPLQIQRNVDYRRERLALEGSGELVVVPAAPRFVRELRLLDVFDRIGPHTDAAFESARAIVAATARDVRARGAFPLFVATNFRDPCLHDGSGESSLAHRLFAGLDVVHVSVDLDPSWAVPHDGHPDLRGSRALADAIVDQLRRAGTLGSAEAAAAAAGERP